MIEDRGKKIGVRKNRWTRGAKDKGLTWCERRRVGRMIDDTLWIRMIVARHFRGARQSDRFLDLTDRGRSSSSLNVRVARSFLCSRRHPQAPREFGRVCG